MIRIAVADDHQMFREGLRQLVTRSGEVEVVGEAGTAAETMQLVRKLDFDVLLLDLSMPGRSGTDLIRQVKAERPRLPILVVSMHGEEQYATRAIAAGAAGYLTKGSPSEQLLQALRKLARGGMHFSGTVAELLARDRLPAAERPAHELLSNREFQVMQMLVRGDSVTAIAQQLHLSVKTVSTHKTQVLRKLQCAGVADLVRYALEHGMAPEGLPTR